MFINTHNFHAFPSFQPRSLFSPGPLGTWTGSGANLDGAHLSTQANLLLMMSTIHSILEQFQGRFDVSGAAVFGSSMGSPSPFKSGLHGPTHCSFGPSPRLSQAEPSAILAAEKTSSPTPVRTGGAIVKPLAQRNGVSCGQASVAMAVNSVTGKSLTDADISKGYGFNLLSALNSESRGSGHRWVDGGNFRKKNWATLEKKLNREKTPVLMGLNGPEFSPSGRGHIVTLLALEGDKVKYADPADGTIKYTSRGAIEQAPGHPQGKFFFYANKG